MDAKEIGQFIGSTIKKFIDEKFDSILKRIDKIESLEIKNGIDGRDGRDGRDGIDGKDAFNLDVRQSIDFNLSYSQGTVAAYKGGLIRAFRNTDPIDENKDLELSGWHVILNGINEINLEFNEELKSFKVKQKTTNGIIKEALIKIPSIIDKGVFVSGQKYDKGDGVTFGGSFFICQYDTTDKPETSKAWRLAVKRGRDGKDKE